MRYSGRIPLFSGSTKDRAVDASNMVVAPTVKGLGAIVDLLVSYTTQDERLSRGGGGGRTQNSTVKKLSRDDKGPPGAPFRTLRIVYATGACEPGSKQMEWDGD